jgi:DNA-binding CsgD family transcriptional regulator
MSRATAYGLPQLLRYLGTFPRPADALEALHHGPLGVYGATASLLWQVRGDELVALASVGHTRAEVDRYATLPLTLGLSVVRAVRTGTVIVDTDVTVAETPPAPASRDMLDDEVRDAILRRGQAASVLRIPLLNDGRSVGAIGLVVDRRWPDDEGTVALTDCISLAMGMWLTHPRVGVSGAAVRPLARDWSLSFTERQREILRLAEQGQSNPAIAAALHVSASSVKQDLQRCMRALRSEDRLAAAARARSLGLL